MNRKINFRKIITFNKLFDEQIGLQIIDEILNFSKENEQVLMHFTITSRLVGLIILNIKNLLES